MMTKDMIGKMTEAGVPAELIVKMLLSEEESIPGSAPVTVGPSPEIPAPEAQAQPDPVPAGSPAVAEEDKKPALSLQLDPEPDPVLTAIRELTGAIQAANLINKSREYEAPDTVEGLADKALAKILTGK